MLQKLGVDVDRSATARARWRSERAEERAMTTRCSLGSCLAVLLASAVGAGRRQSAGRCGDAAATRRRARAAGEEGRRQRPAGRRQHGAALGGLQRRASRWRSCCWPHGANVRATDPAGRAHAGDDGGPERRRAGTAAAARRQGDAATANANGTTPLMFAAASGKVDAVKLLRRSRRRRQRRRPHPRPDAADVRGGARPRRRRQGAGRAQGRPNAATKVSTDHHDGRALQEARPRARARAGSPPKAAAATSPPWAA